MEIRNLIFILTDDCNFDCTYCRQQKEKIYIEPRTIETAVEFFYPFFRESGDFYISFYGGEPMLAFDKLKHTVDYVTRKNRKKKKPIRYTITTNGSLLTGEILDYFDYHQFDILLSYDGLTQDDGRKQGTGESMRQLIKEIKSRSNIKFSVNSVFSPSTVGDLSRSIRHIIESGVPRIVLEFAANESWDDESLHILDRELDLLTRYLRENYSNGEFMPVDNFRPRERTPGRTFRCNGARDRFSISPDGHVWGCYLFHECLKNKPESEDYESYSFGKLDDFIRHFPSRYEALRPNYDDLMQGCFSAGEQYCFLCPEVEYCRVCPPYATLATGSIGKIPPWICQINRLMKSYRNKLFS